MSRKIIIIAALFGALGLFGCPDKKTADKVGGAPKRQLDAVQERLDTATKKMEIRARKADEQAEQ